MTHDVWATLAGPFVECAYATVKGQVRTYVLHQQLLRHLPPAPVRILDVGGGAAHQSLPLARLGHEVTVLDPSQTMLARAEERLAVEPAEVRARVGFLCAAGEDAAVATDGTTYEVVLCHGVLMYLDQPQPMVGALCERVAPGGMLSIMALNAQTMAVRPAVAHRWEDALAAFDATSETGVLGTATRGDTVAELSELMQGCGIEPAARYGGWLFTDWQELPVEGTDVRAVAEVELQASLRDPYRQLSRVFHLVGRRAAGPSPGARMQR